MNPQEAMSLAYALADEARKEDETLAARIEAEMSFPISASDTGDREAPVFLHVRELSEALRAITLLAAGRNPFGDEPFDRLRPEQRTELLRALSIVVCTLVGTPKPIATSSDSKPEDLERNCVSSEPMSKRPLEQYLDHVEREAILEALAEAENNQAEAARLLGIAYRSIRYRIERLKIDA